MFIKTRTLQPKNSSKNKSNQPQAKSYWFLQQQCIICKFQHQILLFVQFWNIMNMFFNNKTASLVYRNLVLSLKNMLWIALCNSGFYYLLIQILEAKKICFTKWTKQCKTKVNRTFNFDYISIFNFVIKGTNCMVQRLKHFIFAAADSFFLFFFSPCFCFWSFCSNATLCLLFDKQLDCLTDLIITL